MSLMFFHQPPFSEAYPTSSWPARSAILDMRGANTSIRLTISQSLESVTESREALAQANALLDRSQSGER
jgi:hypothetical protein